jgi:CHRD domain
MSKITKTTMFATLIATVLVVGIIAAANGITNSVLAQGEQKKFTAKLSGKDEVPPVDTAATGMAQFQLSSDGKEINYDLTTTNLKGFMMAHIHQGKTGENGQPVAPLSMGKGKITSSDLQGPLSGKQLSDLVGLMSNGGAYVNVHTQQHQDGEIRGQVMTG